MNKIIKKLVLLSFVLLLVGCTKPEENIIEDEPLVLQCAPGYIQEGESCVVDSNYEDPDKICKAVDFEYDYESLTYNLVWFDELEFWEVVFPRWLKGCCSSVDRAT